MPSSDNKYILTGWGRQVFEDLECPSGQLCQVRKPGVEKLISAGILDSADTLSTLVNQKHIQRVKGKAPEVDGAALLKDPRNMMNILNLVNKAVVHMVIQPTVLPITVLEKDSNGNEVERPLRDNEREEEINGRVYVDSIDMIDRMFIFQYATGGSLNVEQFRSKFDEVVGGMASL